MTVPPDRTPPAWERPFLAALAETGIASEAAKLAGIGARNAFKRKKGNSTFAAAWETAAALHRAEQARRAMGAASELVANRRESGQIGRAGQTRWSKRGEEAFLNELAVTANVKRAAAAAGFAPPTLYRQRRLNRHFAEAWDAAVAIGRARIEAYLVETADRTFDPDSLAGDAELPKMSVAEAIKVLQLANRSSSIGASAGGSERGWIGEPEWGTPEHEAEMNGIREGILGKLERIHERDEEQKLAAGWTKDGENWVPPGYERRQSDRLGDGPSPPLVVDVKALPAPAEPEDVRGPRVRGL